MTRQYYLPTSELDALHKLLELGIDEIYGCSIQKLLPEARRRALALKALQGAEAGFSKAVTADDEGKVKGAFGRLDEALKGLQQVNYPPDEAFGLRRQELDADIARAKVLQVAIEVWWWRRFSEHVAEFNGLASLPSNERALAGMQVALQKAQAMLEDWPSGDRESHWRWQAATARDEMQGRLKKAQEGHLDTRLEEADYWLDQADSYLGEASSFKERKAEAPNQSYSDVKTYRQSMRAPDPFVALTCLARANAILNGLENEMPSYAGVWSRLQPSIKNARSRLEELQQWTQQFLPEWLSQQRRNEVLNLHNNLKQAWLNWQSNHPDEDAAGFLETGRSIREQVDQLRFYLSQSPTLDCEPWLQELILIRDDNLLQARKLSREIRAYLSVDEQKRRTYLYWAWQRVIEAEECNPDSREIKELKKDVDEVGKRIRQEFANNIQQAHQYLDAIDGRTAATRSGPEGAAQLGTSSDSVRKYLEDAHRYLKEAQGLLKEQLEGPPDWPRQIKIVESRLRSLEELHREVREVANQWDAPNIDLLELIDRTRAFLDGCVVPGPIKSILEASIYGRPVGQADPLSHALEYQMLIEEYFEPQQPELQSIGGSQL